jgi:hypothetical protein
LFDALIRATVEQAKRLQAPEAIPFTTGRSHTMNASDGLALGPSTLQVRVSSAFILSLVFMNTSNRMSEWSETTMSVLRMTMLASH